ncbi:DUF6301 family protein [Buchananella hordeovulneris]|uniref:DUF6301 family protein n=1 Tax=Buchananella hordeovulneris TaxID=52770 RepID=UPI003CCFE049
MHALWPLTLEQGVVIAKQLEWKPSNVRTNLFCSDLAEADEADSRMTVVDGMVLRVSFPLSSIADEERAFTLMICELVEQVEELLVKEWGEPYRDADRSGIRSSQWELCSGVTVRISWDRTTADASVWSPELTALMKESGSGE